MSGVDPARTGSTRDRGIFALLLALVGLIALFAFWGTGPMGIEERFSSALGITPDGGGHPPEHEDSSGFALEGNPLLYAIILVLICVACWAIYRNFGV